MIVERLQKMNTIKNLFRIFIIFFVHFYNPLNARILEFRQIKNMFRSHDALQIKSYLWPLKIQQRFRSAIKNSQLNMTDFRKIYSSCVDFKQRTPQLIEDSTYLIEQPQYCTGRRKNTWILFAIHSHPRNIYRRNVIRSTWGSINRIGKRKIALIFLMGNSGSAEIDKSVREENNIYRDILQRNFTEDYRNMTRKHITLFEWLTQGNCPNLTHLVKVDDDTFVDIFHLANLLESQPSLFKNGFYCSATRGAKPARPNAADNSKWIVNKAEFSGDVYPTYCEGFGYVLDPSVIPYIYWCSIFKPFMWIDDVYVTGILAQHLDIKRVRFLEGHSYARIEPNIEQGAFLDFIFLTSYYSEFLPTSFRKLWSAALKNSYGVMLH